MAEINIDHYLDYRAIYSELLQKRTISGSQILGSCPLHTDKRASFSANLETGKCQCFSCGFKGNYIALYAKIHGIETKDAFKQICEQHNIELSKPEQEKPVEKEPERQIYTLDQYAQEKHLERDFLEAVFNLSDYRARNGNTSVKIPYLGIDGKIYATRYRHSPKSDPRFTWQKGSKVCLYGLQFWESIRESGSVILVEGESDCQTLTRLGLHSLGVPGASTLNDEAAQSLQGLKIYLHVEPDKGGQVFLTKCTEKLKSAGIEEIYKISCSDLGAKDPSELYIRDGEQAGEEIQNLINNAKRIDETEPEETVKGAPVNLATPEGYYISDAGIGTLDKDGIPRDPFLSTPILITKLINNLDATEKKLEITVKRGNSFNNMIISRADLTNTNIMKVAQYTGAIITSANAREVIQYLTKLEDANIGRIPEAESVERFGWIGDDRFLPYQADNVELEVTDPRLSLACTTRGTLDNWIEAMQPHRERYIFRFILASSFAAPLLKPLKIRSFVIYNWSDSRGGKTAALKAALSVWGDPDALKMTFNSTINYLEGKASTMCDLPMGIDERQQAYSTEEVAKFFYMIGNETSKGRMNKNQTVRALKNWRTIGIATGEEPAATDKAMDGCRNRMIELVGAPFEGLENEAMKIHQTCADHCGNAGKKYIEAIIKMRKAKGDHGFQRLYDMMEEEIDKIGNIVNAAHISMLAVVGVADILASTLIFGENAEQAKQETIDMIRRVIMDLKDIKDNEMPDVNVSACNALFDFYQANKKQFFDPEISRTLYGFDDGEPAKYNTQAKVAENLYIFPSVMEKIIEGYSVRKTLKFMADNGIIEVQSGRKTIKKWNPYAKQHARMISIRIKKLREMAGIDDPEMTI